VTSTLIHIGLDSPELPPKPSCSILKQARKIVTEIRSQFSIKSADILECRQVP